MQIRKRPYGIDFSGNNPEFVLRTTPYRQKGRCVSMTYLISRLPEGTLRLSYGVGTDYKVWEWNMVANAGDALYEMTAAPSGSAVAMLDIFEGKFLQNPDLRLFFDISARIDNGQLYVKITSKEPESKNLFFVYAENNNLTAVTVADGVSGINQKLKPNYRVLAFFAGQTSGESFRTPDMMLEESNGDVHIDCSLLNAYFPKPDIPEWGELYVAKACQAAILTARLWYGEMYADDMYSIPILHTLDRSQMVTLLNGRVSQYAADNNIPDWTSCNDDHLHLKTGVDILGQDNGEKVIVPPGVEQYIYLYNYSSVNMTVRVIVRATFADGTTDDDWQDENLTILPGVNRITVREDEAVAWTVTITENTFHRTVTRHFVTRAFEYGFHTFLMLNALNLYESFPVEFLSREEQTEGERRIIAGLDSYGTTDHQTVYTAKCTQHSASRLKLMRSAFEKQDNLLLDGQYAWRIDMVPGSLVLENEAEDVLECEFKFRLREKVNRKPQIIEITDALEPTSQIMKQDTIFK